MSEFKRKVIWCVRVWKLIFALAGGLLGLALVGCAPQPIANKKFDPDKIVLPPPGPVVAALSKNVRQACGIDRSVVELVEDATADQRRLVIAEVRNVGGAFGERLTWKSRPKLFWLPDEVEVGLSCEALKCASGAGDPIAAYSYASRIYNGKCDHLGDNAVAVLEKSLETTKPIEDYQKAQFNCDDNIGSETTSPDEYYLCPFGLAESWWMLGQALDRPEHAIPETKRRADDAFARSMTLGRLGRPVGPD